MTLIGSSVHNIQCLSGENKPLSIKFLNHAGRLGPLGVERKSNSRKGDRIIMAEGKFKLRISYLSLHRVHTKQYPAIILIQKSPVRPSSPSTVYASLRVSAPW
jgi:hypothetical protein